MAAGRLDDVLAVVEEQRRLGLRADAVRTHSK